MRKRHMIGGEFSTKADWNSRTSNVDGSMPVKSLEGAAMGRPKVFTRSFAAGSSTKRSLSVPATCHSDEMSFHASIAWLRKGDLYRAFETRSAK